MLFPYLFAYNVDFLINLAFLRRDVALYDVQITAEIYTPHNQNTSNMQKADKLKKKNSFAKKQKITSVEK